ncbi:Chitotriosidase-1 [Dactylellina cionopaga]|nr:Chitotriosidase-1 [Dactylellina cionopaga]
MAPAYRTIGYYVDWAIYGRNFKPQDLNGSQFTHILFAFVKINPDSGEITLADPWADTDIHWDQPWDTPGTNLYGIFYQLYQLKKSNRKLKNLLSIGGWTYSQNGNFPNGANTPEKREKFASSAVEMVKNFGLDGIDLDWEYPKDATEAANFVDLLKRCREHLNALSAGYGATRPHFELSVAAPCGAENYTKLDIRGMDQYLDFWNMMAYDFAGSWSSVAGHASNIYPSSTIPQSTDFSFEKCLEDYLHAGIRSDKIVLGMPLYGRGFANTDGPGKGYSGGGAGNWEPGVWDYKNLPLPGSQVSEDQKMIASWCYDPAARLMISYDTPNVAKWKAAYIKQKGLGGAMWWETSGDKVGPDSLVEHVIDSLGGQAALDHRQNNLSYPGSKYDNIRA